MNVLKGFYQPDSLRLVPQGVLIQEVHPQFRIDPEVFQKRFGIDPLVFPMLHLLGLLGQILSKEHLFLT
ncbi:uncharacterized protein CTRU02_206546 [Colletotrichum truncatum]|uniref:Uncharacterized protein n=2 Tax=Colletotrichum truncatum TaxID=5467 RepID=A0ACC3Z6Z4_COLTU